MLPIDGSYENPKRINFKDDSVGRAYAKQCVLKEVCFYTNKDKFIRGHSQLCIDNVYLYIRLHVVVRQSYDFNFIDFSYYIIRSFIF